MLDPDHFSRETVKKVGDALAINWSRISIEQFANGMEVELEHGTTDPKTNVTDDDMMLTGKIALAHLKEFPDYYSRLEKMESEAKIYWQTNEKGL